MAALESENEMHVDPTQFRAVPCPDCGRLLLGCIHDVARYRRGEHRMVMHAKASQ